jgi:FkbM family methyltransferase
MSRLAWRSWRNAERAALDRSPATEIHCEGVFIPIDRSVMGPHVISRILNRTHERRELNLARRLARPDDVIVEIGAGRGLTAVFVYAKVKPRGYVCYEPNRHLTEYSRRLFERNGFPITIVEKGLGEGAMVTKDAPLGSSGQGLHDKNEGPSGAKDGGGDKAASGTDFEVETVSLGDIIEAHRPTMIIMDVEGMEHAYSDDPALGTVGKLVLETHPYVYGEQGREEMFANFHANGLRQRFRAKNVYAFERPGKT